MEKIDASTFIFFRDLGRNNNREWFNANRERYNIIRESFIKFLEGVYPGLLAFDPAIEGIDIRKSLFRINRDVRFSDDKSPYKTTIAAALISGGRKNFSEYAGYYLHIENGNSLIAGGAYMPPSGWLSAIRSKIDRESELFRSIISDPVFTGIFGSLEGEQLKGAPKGFTRDNPNIDLLRYKSYLVVRNLTETEVLSDRFGEIFLETSKAMKPLNDFLNEATQQE